ncbi:MAG: exodeoxyribonuclease III [Candidatus Aquirickettsiella gammari]|uniref:Exodeoxyribonuclease III n=1 Tax=Candidatus Aquirickettsiella gammari TaxID=2016198 RepID=A0A370CIQ6_9COXI|nr:MAG: exodeoxyribonuclease III [Candidatus Aquirickettsiella gammari]
MRIMTLNLNGIRSAARKGFFDWAKTQKADVICLQETKAQEWQLDTAVHLKDYQAYFFDAEKKGYSGVAVYSRIKPDTVVGGLGWECADKEGRYLQLNFPNLSIASLYMPSGSSGEIRQKLKFQFLDHYKTILKRQRRQKRDFIICGDWNIAHKPIDLKNWRSNQKHSGFLPEERAWLDQVLGPIGYVDAFREINQQAEQYTWWSNRGRAWDNNVGWRIDYQIITPGLRDKVKSVSIYKDRRFSDHAPLTIDYVL